MDQESMASLRLDKRLALRRGWISPEELAQELEALPDSADKILVAEDDDAADTEESAPEPESAPAPGLPD